MTAVFKREFKSYFNNMLGYTIIAGTLFLVAIYVYTINFGQGFPNFEYALSDATAYLFSIIIPLLTMKTFAEERRQKTDQLLLTSPLSVSQIVIGKFLGVMAVFGIALLLMAPYPFILNLMGYVNFLTAYSALVGMFFMVCALAAIGIFISSLTENQIISAVITLCVMLVLSFMKSITSSIPIAARVNYIILTVVAVAVVLTVYALTKNFIAAAVFAVALEGALILLYRVFPRVLEGSVSKILSVFDIFNKMGNFVYGMFDITTVIYYLTVAALFLFFTVQALEKRRWS